MPTKRIAVHCAHDKMVSISKLQPNPRNPNQHPPEQIALLAQIIKEQGWRAPISVSTRSGLIVRGHGRLAAATLLELRTVPIDYQDYFSDELEWADLLADNRIAELAEMDLDGVRDILRELDGAIADMDITGFEADAFSKIMESGSVDEKEKTPPLKIEKTTSLAGLAPTDEEMEILRGRTVLVEYSGGKDSTASMLWCKHFLPDSEIVLLYVEMGADFPGMLDYIRDTSELLGLELRILRSPKNMYVEFWREGVWPQFRFPYCHKILHAALDKEVSRHDANSTVVVRGGRISEKVATGIASESRWLDINKQKAYKYFQPLYFSDKDTAGTIIEDAGVALWEGYGNGLQRTACTICPGQKPIAYWVIKNKYPDVWTDLIRMEIRLGPGSWSRGYNEHGKPHSFEEMAEFGRIEEGKSDGKKASSDSAK